MERDPRYRRKLLWLLSVATFFEGYDTFVLAFVLALILANLAEPSPRPAWSAPSPAWGRWWRSSWRRRPTGSAGGCC